MALSDAERARLYRERRKAGEKPVRYRRPADRRSKPQQWADAVETLLGLLDGYQDWRDNLPPGLADIRHGATHRRGAGVARSGRAVAGRRVAQGLRAGLTANCAP